MSLPAVSEVLTDLGAVQIPILAGLLLGACAGKLARTIRHRSIGAGLGPNVLFPIRLRKPGAAALCVIELWLGTGLILTAGRAGAGDPAKLIRISIALLFVVMTCVLIELRSTRPDVGCGCFGELSRKPVDDRSITRSALLAVAALETVRLGPLQLPRTAGHVALLLGLLIGELAVIALISPEAREALVRLGYSAPCEVRPATPEQTLTALHRSSEWRQHGSLVTQAHPSDVWRELCWRYFAFPSGYAGREAQLIFAVYLDSRHPAVVSALVGSTTGDVLPWPARESRPGWLDWLGRRFGGERQPDLGSEGGPERSPRVPDLARVPQKAGLPGRSG